MQLEADRLGAIAPGEPKFGDRPARTVAARAVVRFAEHGRFTCQTFGRCIIA